MTRDGSAGAGVVRQCHLRSVERFDAEALERRLLEGQGVQDGFRLIESSLPSSSPTSMAVEADDEHVYVGVLLWETLGFGLAPNANRETQGAGRNVVEVIWVPWEDGVGHLQFGAGPGQDVWFNGHWPYHDGRDDLSARPRFEVDWRVQIHGEDVSRVAIFRFGRDAVIAPGVGCVGFNILRSELRSQENAAWCSIGSAFPDPACTGILQLQESDDEVQSCGEHLHAPPRSRSTSPKPERRPRLAITYDFPDECLNGPYTPQLLGREMKTLREAGVTRIYWIDYPFFGKSFERLAQESPECAQSLPYRADQIDFARKTHKAFDGDVLETAVRLARESGLEFYTVIKPFDLWPKWKMPAKGTGVRAVSWGDPFREAISKCAFSRNPAWNAEVAGPITELTLWSDNDGPAGFDTSAIQLRVSDDNIHYKPAGHFEIEEGIAIRPRMQWTAAGPQAIDNQSERVRFIKLTGINASARYIAIQAPDAATHTVSDETISFPNGFGNQRFLLAQAARDGQAIPITAGWPAGQKKSQFEFDTSQNKAEWSCVTEATQRRIAWEPGSTLALSLERETYVHGMLDPTFEAVQDYWLDQYVQRAIDAGVDGVDVRIAHHQGCANWLDYAWASPVLDEFRKRMKRDPQPIDADYQAARRIRGEAYTRWLGRSKAMLAAASCKLEHHLEARMVVPPEHDTYLQIHWDWQTWINEGLVDGLNLKYLGARHPWVHERVLPKARNNGVAVRVIEASLDPRNHPRALESHLRDAQLIRDAGLDGLTLYEAWTYLRTTPQGDLLCRGSAGPIFQRFAEVFC